MPPITATPEEESLITSFAAQATSLVPGCKILTAQRVHETDATITRIVMSLPENTSITSDAAYTLHQLAAQLSEVEHQEIVVSFVPLIAEGEDLNIAFLPPDTVANTNITKLQKPPKPRRHSGGVNYTILGLAASLTFFIGLTTSQLLSTKTAATRISGEEQMLLAANKELVDRYLTNLQLRSALSIEDDKAVLRTIQLVNQQPN